MSDATHVASGKVREIYALDDDRLLLVASDRISTFDVVLPTEIPDKGRVLTGLSAFWFARTSSIVPKWPLPRSNGCARRGTRSRRYWLVFAMGFAALAAPIAASAVHRGGFVRY